MPKWDRIHMPSGFTAFELRARKCRMTVAPKDWTNPKGPATWSTTCGDWRDKRFDHRKGSSKTVANAKAAALRAARRLRKLTPHRQMLGGRR